MPPEATRLTPANELVRACPEPPTSDRCLDHETCRRTSAICLASHISHGVNNALNLVTLNAPLLADLWNSILPILEEHAAGHPDFRIDGMPWSRLREDVPALFEGLLEGTHRVRDFLLEIRDAAKLRQAGSPEPFDLRDAAARAVECSRRILPDAPEPAYLAAETPVPVYGVFGSVMQACLQLIDNGRRAAARTGGGVTVRVFANGEGARGIFSVRDEGPGLPQGARADLCRPFHGAWPGAALPSLGLGLLIANRVAADHGGFLEIRAGQDPPDPLLRRNDPGEPPASPASGGATVSITLPLRTASAS